MPENKISPAVRQFIQDHITSVEQLEVLLLRSGSPEKEWTVAEISQRVYSEASSVTMRLESLRVSGLVSARSVSEPLFRYSPLNESLNQAVRSFEQAYRIYKDSIITLIYSRPSENLRAFSDAFRIRKND